MSGLFAGEYVKNIRTVGAVAPSSRFLAAQMIRPIDFSVAATIVQFGPGTGSFTKTLLAHRHPQTALLLIERNRVFYDILVEQFGKEPHVTIVHGSAVDIGKILKKYKLPKKVEYIVSGLPFASLPASESKAILLEAAHHLHASGAFITFQYTLLKKPLLARYFSSISKRREWRNLPPAYILECKN